MSGVSKCLNYCEIFVGYTQFTNVAMGCILHPGSLWAAG